MQFALRKQDNIMQRFVAGTLGRKRKEGNIIVADGMLCSYGLHYPLLIDLGGGLRAVNSQGYSVTTSKHISYARGYAQIDFTCPNYYAGLYREGYERDNLVSLDRKTRRKAVRYFLNREKKQLEKELATLRANATRKRSNALERLEKINKGLEYLRLYPIKKSL